MLWKYIIFMISFTNGIILNNCSDNIYPNSGDIVVCTTECNECNIYCISIDQCKNEIYVYSGALHTNIYCLNDNSCEGSIFYLGNNIDYNMPNNYSIQNFSGEYQSIDVFCIGHTSCKQTNFYIYGNYINGVLINATGVNGIVEDSFQDSILICNLNDGQLCTLECGDNENSCANTIFECYGEFCECIGYGCEYLNNGNVLVKSRFPTINPTLTPTYLSKTPSTIPTTIPTITPTQIPTNYPTTTIPTQNPTNIPIIKTNITNLNTDTVLPSKMPIPHPTISPTIKPSNYPSPNPTKYPTLKPSISTTSNQTVSYENKTISLGIFGNINLVLLTITLGLLLCCLSIFVVISCLLNHIINYYRKKNSKNESEYVNNIVTPPISNTPSNGTINSEEGFEMRYFNIFEEKTTPQETENTNSIALPAKIIDGGKVTSTGQTPTPDGILIKCSTTNNTEDQTPLPEQIGSSSTLTIETPKSNIIIQDITPEFRNVDKISVKSMSTYDLL